jgi:hypothetical protein
MKVFHKYRVSSVDIKDLDCMHACNENKKVQKITVVRSADMARLTHFILSKNISVCSERPSSVSAV